MGQSATVQVDGANGSVTAPSPRSGRSSPATGSTPTRSWSTCPPTNDTLFTGSTANVVIDTGSVSNVVAVPTSAVETAGTRSYVLEFDKGV